MEILLFKDILSLNTQNIFFGVNVLVYLPI